MVNFGFEIKENMHIQSGYTTGSGIDKVVEIFYNGELVKTYKMPVTTQFILSEKELIDLLYQIHRVIMGKRN